MIKIRDLHKTYRMGQNEVRALNGVSLTIENGDYVAIMGPSGSGKSTLMHILGFLDVPSSGSYQVNDEETAHFDQDQLAYLRHEMIGFVFQQFHLLPRMRLNENVSLPLLYSRKKVSKKDIESIIERVGLAQRMDHKPNELSGGQQQRVAIARALVNHPQMILADEPTGNLDSASEAEILAILDELNRQGITIVVVTHEEEIARHAKRIIRMRDGNITSDERLRPIEGSAIAPAPLKGRGFGQGALELFDYAHQGIRSLASNKVRTALSTLGVLIGVAAVVTMMAIGKGATEYIQTRMSTLGNNLLTIRQGAIRNANNAEGLSGRSRLVLSDIDAIRSGIPQAANASGSVRTSGKITHLNRDWRTQVNGVSASYVDMRSSFAPQTGRFFTQAEDQARARVAVIGPTIVRQLFGNQDPIGEEIKINRINFQVIGVLPSQGANAFQDNDDLIMIPLNTAMYRVLGSTYVNSIDVQILDPSQMESAKTAVLNLINIRHHIPFADRADAFDIINLQDVQQVIQQTVGALSMLLAMVAAISLLVGGIGIMNIMLVSVTERTREIGLRKALGAKRRNILSQFLAESVVVSLLGGSLGVLLGTWAAATLAKVAGWTTIITVDSVLLAVLFSCSIGIVFGLYPAMKASKLNPIDALRNE